MSAILSPLNVAALTQTSAGLSLRPLEAELLEIYCELGVAIVQMAPCDDRIICGHIRTAARQLKDLLPRFRRETEARESALKAAESFIADELQTRLGSFLPNPDGSEAEYIQSATDALRAVRLALGEPQPVVAGIEDGPDVYEAPHV